MTLKDLRHAAAANVLALHSQNTYSDCSLETLAHFLHRSPRTLWRWEQLPPDRVTEFAYRYLAGHLFGWEAARWNLKRRELELYTSGTQLTAIHRNHIEHVPEFLALWQQVHALQSQPAPGALPPTLHPISGGVMILPNATAPAANSATNAPPVPIIL